MFKHYLKVKDAAWLKSVYVLHKLQFVIKNLTTFVPFYRGVTSLALKRTVFMLKKKKVYWSNETSTL